jgi:hypothetical protein
MLNRPDPTFNRPEVKSMLILQRNPNTFFSSIPEELIAQTKYFLDLLDALKEAADGKLTELKARLDTAKKNKELLKVLLLQKDDTVTPAGITAKNTTLLGCAICAGDPEIIAMIKPYFLELPNGEKELENQLAYYGSCIEEIKTQKPEDLTWLIEIILASSPKDVAEELATGDDYNPDYPSLLRNALNKFRADKLDPAKRIIDTPRMHCNYQNLIHAYEILDNYWDKLVVNGSYDKHYLISRQIIGLIQLLELPAFERYVFARGQIDAVTAGKTLERSCGCLYGNDTFPGVDINLIKSRSGVGFNSYISIRGTWLGQGAFAWPIWDETRVGAGTIYKTYVKQKPQTCGTYAAHSRENSRAYNSLT